MCVSIGSLRKCVLLLNGPVGCVCRRVGTGRRIASGQCDFLWRPGPESRPMGDGHNHGNQHD